MLRNIRKLTVISFLLLSLMLAGCRTAGSAATKGSPESSSDSRYKVMSGKVAVFGTSLWAIEPGPTGIASRLKELTSFEVTDNTVMGGMAARVEEDPLSEGSLISILLYNDDVYSKRMRDSIREADYVILDFGGNDCSSGVPASGDGNSFENALKLAVTTIREMNPGARIILITPIVGWEYIDGEYVSIVDIDCGGGTIMDFIDTVEKVAQEEALFCVNMSEVIVFSKDEPLKYFEDGSHLTEYGRMVYAQYLTEQIYGRYYS